MHSFIEIVNRCAVFTIQNLNKINDETIEALQTSGSTSLVKTLQMVQLQKIIFAVGMFSIFEAYLQEGLDCTDGFGKAKKILEDVGKSDVKENFDNMVLAINVLKHGRGRSYDLLVAKSCSLPFKMKLPNEPYFLEGDVSEFSTLIQVDDAFIQLCGDTIYEVSVIIRNAFPDFY
ncbi:MAG: hypothetical protein A2499_01060 [Stygiobacter sp. RIFOXYC12_FULL_38_8]|nr:MAG: hypothetical protein A2X62_13435 [Stygiobacter sp. GWC2_38_9]OGV06131.1 MAG: hypothetical protein A2299_07980 [Stygiobacter sp. RIFOXYB2_FULL_37_11]OGV11370.1 MAG: hypothetical protein A2237_10715 [Stygiobacter sp. RIFOXYA2_FULL_38_8]OGV16804.1 MAG: hypothetical protein A2440_05535 [Stygiobacter sp. RIFOXYC2_FULL_38_25]OGV29407.1 MAG: hypothetical protein A2499_01060 [Stygiobacter sp. RIFOXYC12_FULL_38_8]OGV82845.1 MAG: hypothetical protein A2X65_12620 [Stygiobacter sp. GWF2_38_21]RJQ